MTKKPQTKDSSFLIWAGVVLLIFTPILWLFLYGLVGALCDNSCGLSESIGALLAIVVITGIVGIIGLAVLVSGIVKHFKKKK